MFASHSMGTSQSTVNERWHVKRAPPVRIAPIAETEEPPPCCDLYELLMIALTRWYHILFQAVLSKRSS